MRIPKIYLETSVFNFYYAEDAPNERDDTVRLFEEIRQGKYEPYTSDYVLGELRQASEPKRKSMVDLILAHNITVLPESLETQRLAGLYVSEGIIPERQMTDALHIASTAVNNLDYIVSYNFKHIVKMKTITMTEIVNFREHYKRIGIFSPTQVVENEN